MWRSLLQNIALNGCFWVRAILTTMVYTVVGTTWVLLHALWKRDQRQTLRLIRRTISHYGSAILRCGWPWMRIEYVDFAPTDAPPLVAVANHRSFSDAFLMACLPLEVVQVVNIWPFKIPLLGQVARIAGYLSIRQMSVDAFLQRGTALLRNGVTVIAFPEGTRSGSRQMGPFHGTAFRLAQVAGVGVVPLAISGNENIPRRGSLWLRPGLIRVHKLPAITPQEAGKLTPFELKNLVRARLAEHLRKMEEESPRSAMAEAGVSISSPHSLERCGRC